MTLSPEVCLKSMAHAILASDNTIQKNPQLIRKLVLAEFKGMRDIMANPEEAARVYIRAVPAQG